MRHFTSPSCSQQRLLAARAHGLRKAQTHSEQKLWAELSGGKLGVAFRRQVPVGHRFIVDFLAPSIKLVVVVDGSAHQYRHGADAKREHKLGRLGYVVLRLDAERVVRNLVGAGVRVREPVEALLTTQRGTG
jgi:very-short-patch-repair endonuclease